MVESLRVNQEIHRHEVKESFDLGYARGTCNKQHLCPVASESVPRLALGLGPSSPFSSDELIFTTESPVFSDASCAAIRKEAASHMADGGCSRFTMTDTNRDANVHSLPLTRRLLNHALRSTLYPLAATCFPSAVAAAEDLYVYRAIVVQYDAAAGLTHQPVHRDGSLVTAIISLNARDEYCGGGTWIEPLGRSIMLPRGHLLLHPSALRHSGGRISNGERWVLVIFIGHTPMHFAEHSLRFKARAELAHAAGDTDAELRLLQDGLQVSPDFAELWVNAAGCLLNRGDLKAAIHYYLTASKLNPADPRPFVNFGAAVLENQGPPEVALQAFEHALSLNHHLVPAWKNRIRLLLMLGHRRAAADALAMAPSNVQVELDGMLH